MMARDSMLARVRHLMKGSVQDMIDRLEQRNADVVMRQAIREVDEAIADVEEGIGQVAARMAQLERHEKWLEEKKSALADRIRLALEEEEENLARSAISREMSLERQIEEARKERDEQSRQLKELEELHDALLARRGEMVKRFREWLEMRRMAGEEADGGDIGKAPVSKMEVVRRRVAQAEKTMHRVASGGLLNPFLEDDLEDAAAVGKLDEMARQREIDKRLATYREAVVAGANA